MIKFDKLWETMKRKGITQYDLYTTYGVNRAQVFRLKHNLNVQTNTLDRLCNILECDLDEIAEHFQANNFFK